jgi:AraC-like DNA-binding protein
VIRTRSLDEAHHAVSKHYLRHEITTPEPARLQMALNVVSDQLATIGFLSYRAESTFVMPPTEDSYHVNLTLRGRTLAARSDGARAVTEARCSGAVLLPDQLTTVTWEPNAQQLILKIPRAALESHLAGLLGRSVDSVIDFELGFDLLGPRGRSLLSAVEFLVRELDRPGGIAEVPIARTQLETFVFTQLLLAAPHRYWSCLAEPPEEVNARRLKPVVDYMEEHASRLPRLEELARVAGVSVRTLQASFQRAYGHSPLTHLRNIRLQRVRAELLGGATGATVTDVAMRWGFFHFGRFAQQYRNLFGELPSKTRRATREASRLPASGGRP